MATITNPQRAQVQIGIRTTPSLGHDLSGQDPIRIRTETNSLRLGIRSLVPDDWRSIAKNNEEIGTGGRNELNDVANWVSNLCAFAASKNGVATVSIESGEVVGLCHVLRCTPKPSSIGRLGIAVLPDYQNEGRGTALIESVVEQSIGMFRVIDLEVQKSNYGAKRLYERLGFRYTEMRPTFGRTDETSLQLMYIEL
jgi:ribosomal protein S18 acetylase RimI-like enzyme